MDESPGNKAADHLAVSRAIQMPESNVARMHVRDLQLRTDRLSKSLEGGLDSEEKISFIGYVKSSWSIVSDGCSREEGNNRISILTIKTNAHSHDDHQERSERLSHRRYVERSANAGVQSFADTR